jgi:hypothetical protein
MTIRDYQEAKTALHGLRHATLDSKNLAKTVLPELLEVLITLKGHAWCMDVKSERRRMAKLISKEIESLMLYNRRHAL